jgi:hypothetical protein
MSDNKWRSFRVDYTGLRSVLKTEVVVIAVFSPDPAKSMTITALWDTGATHSVINSKTAKMLELMFVDQGVISGVNSMKLADVAMVNVRLPNHLIIENLRVTIADIKNADMLIGMDVISFGDFIICNSGGRTSFSFVIPPFGDRPDWIKKSDALNSL